MTGSLAIITPQVGSRTETFIRRQIEELAPRRTCVVTRRSVGGIAGHWRVSCPMLALHDPIFNGTSGIFGRVADGVARRSGVRSNDPVDRAERFLRRHGSRVVLSHYLDLSVDWLPLGARLGARFFAHAHGYDASAALRDDDTRERMKALAKADGIIVVNRVMRDRMLQLGVPEQRLVVIPYGVDVPESFTPRAVGEVVHCVSVGRLVPKKAPLLLLDAFARAADAVPSLRLTCVGEGPLLEEAQAHARDLRLGDKVTFTGAMPHGEILRMLDQADSFLQHSVVAPDTGDEEGVPVAILEAMAHGLPVISTRHAGIPEAVEDGASGHLVPEGDTVAMAERIVMLARDAGMRRSMGEHAWQTARERFTWQREMQELRELMSLD